MSLQQFFSPRSVAIVGASREKGKVGYEILVSLRRGKFPGKIFPINSKATEVEGLKCYPDLKSIGEVPDLAVVVVPAKFVIEIMEQCAQLGIKAVVIITAGFKEVGEAGRRLEEQVVAIARRSGIRVIGPNCLGVMVPSSKLNASFGGDLPVPGAISFMSQSGALMSAILDMANANGIGFSKLVSFGNKCDVNDLDTLLAFGADPETRVITGYLESISQGEQFIQAAEKISREKPILLMKSGGTSAGAKAASSHTGSLAGGEAAYVCVFERTGMIRCPSIKCQFDYAQAFAYQPLPAGKRVAVVTNAGGPGIMAADAIEREGLSFAKLTSATESALAAQLPAAANIHNPIDVLGDALANRYEFAIATALADPGVDVVLVLLTPQAMTECTATAEALARVSKKNPSKPILACFMGALKIHDALQVLRVNRIPQYDSPESAARTIRVMCDYAAWKVRPARTFKQFPVDKATVQRIIDHALQAGEREIGEAEAKEVLQAYGLQVPRGVLAKTAAEAVKAASDIGFPVVMKIVSPEIIHKSDVGGVKVGLADAGQVQEAYEGMMRRVAQNKPDAHILGVSIQQMCMSGQELILGMNRDPQFGPMIMFGLGGIMVEVLKDVTFALAPITADDAKTMIEKTRAYKLLQGVRGQPGVDLPVLIDTLLRISQLVTDFPQIKEMDINPFKIGPAGTPAMAVDGRMSVEKI
jgi:acetyltransferase